MINGMKKEMGSYRKYGGRVRVSPRIVRANRTERDSARELARFKQGFITTHEKTAEVHSPLPNLGSSEPITVYDTGDSTLGDSQAALKPREL